MKNGKKLSTTNIVGELMEENGKVVKCPKCGSENVVPVNPFDYVKRCNDCYTENGKHTEFLTGVHN
jgi:hypothetical protein